MAIRAPDGANKQTENIASQAGQTKVEGCRRRRRGNVHKKEEKGLHQAFVFCPETECKYKYNHKNENTKAKTYKYRNKQYGHVVTKIHKYNTKRHREKYPYSVLINHQH